MCEYKEKDGGVFIWHLNMTHLDKRVCRNWWMTKDFIEKQTDSSVCLCIEQPVLISWTTMWTQQAIQLCLPYSMKSLAKKRLRNRREGKMISAAEGKGGRTSLMWQAGRLASTSHRDVKCCGWLRRITFRVFFCWWEIQNTIRELVTSCLCVL